MDALARMGGSGADPFRTSERGAAPASASPSHVGTDDGAAFTVTVGIEPGSLAALAAAGASLFAFPTFASSNRTAVPLVVEAVHPLSRSHAIRWSGDFGVFAAYDDLSAGDATPPRRTIFPGNEERVRLGSSARVGPSLQFLVTASGTAGALTFRTTEPGRFTCGLVFGAGSRLGCAATLTAGLDVTFAPLRSIFLMFSTSSFEAGAWVDRSTSPGLLVDLTGFPTRAVTFEQNAPGGWVEADQAWARAIPAGTSLTELLRHAPQVNEPW